MPIVKRRVPWLNAKAEGTCCDVPYDTEIASSEGCTIHFWLGTREPTDKLLSQLEAIATLHRDVIGIYYSEGEPTGYWAHADF